MRAGEVRLWPVTDPANLNARRAEIGLPALDDDTIAGAWTAAQLREHGYHLAEDTTATDGGSAAVTGDQDCT